MSETTTTTTVRLEVTVDVPQERAFTLFVERFDEVKPRDHTLLTVPLARSVLEPFVGGRVYDLAADGTTIAWGEVLAFEPPARFAFSWRLDPEFELETDPARFSEVEVRFVAVGPSRTQVELEHRHLDRHGDGWPSERDAVAGRNGWPVYLANFVAVVDGA